MHSYKIILSFSQGMIDTRDFYEIDAAANDTRYKIETSQWQEALVDFSYTQSIISEKTCNIDVFNILTKRKCDHLSPQELLFLNEGIRSFLI